MMERTHITLSFEVPGIQVNIGPSECGLPSAMSLNCLVSPSCRELRPYPQSSLYIQYLAVPSLAVLSTCLPQCRYDHYYAGHSKHHCILPHHCWLIRPNYSSWSFHLNDLELSMFIHIKLLQHLHET